MQWGVGGGERYRQIKKKRGGRMSETLKRDRHRNTEREREICSMTLDHEPAYTPIPPGDFTTW